MINRRLINDKLYYLLNEDFSESIALHVEIRWRMSQAEVYAF